MKFKIKTLTPIWTGNVNRECTKLRETSILGSLRWWFEAIVRGFGGYACDSVGEVVEKCKFDVDKYKNCAKSEELICPVCYVFGTTGWSRRFRFEINQSFREMYYENLVIVGNKRNWYYPSGVVSCGNEKNVIRCINPLWKVHGDRFGQNSGKNEMEYDLESILRVLFAFISNWGMIGGKTAIGYGVVRFENDDGDSLRVDGDDFNEFIKYLNDKKNDGINDENAPKLNEMFFAKFKVKKECLNDIIKKVDESIKKHPEKIYKCNGTEEHSKTAEEFLKKLKNYYGFIPISALIRKELRKSFRKEYVKQNEDKIPDWLKNLSEEDLQKLRHFLMGELGRFSVINVSHIYWNSKQWEFRIWGWISKKIKIQRNKSRNKEYLEISREKVVKYLKELFNSQDFWKSVFGADCVEKPDEVNYIVEYPKNKWNFIDLGEANDIKRAFKDMLCGDGNGQKE